ncbi:hypothetical protein [Kitasatospora sp. NPDC001175]|uniref:hypothetical protein n=1 Tax=Kitasatospora sp. NPDC001175 TaxID=3157103 RepID=UPI003CFD25D9
MTIQHDAALRAMLRAADRHRIPVNVRQVGLLLAAAAEHLQVDPSTQAEAPCAPQSGWVPAERTAAALRSLVAGGWPLTYLAPRAGKTVAELSALMRRRPHVTARTEAAVLALEAALRGVDPVEAGVPVLAARKARNWAQREGWGRQDGERAV